MSNRGRKIFIFVSVVLPILIYCYFYYEPILRNAPFKSGEFVSIKYKWGVGKTLDNSYDSSTGAYQYLDKKDSLVKTNVKLRQDDIIYLHNKATQLGFWNFPSLLANNTADTANVKVLRYELEFNYKRVSKKVVYLSDYNEIPKLRDLAVQMKTLVEQTINSAEERYGKKN
jgi:hypothetical protein